MSELIVYCQTEEAAEIARREGATNVVVDPDHPGFAESESEETFGVVQLPAFVAYCNDGCGGIITEGWASRTFNNEGDAKRALRDHRKDVHE